jgi:hypothetical protein
MRPPRKRNGPRGGGPSELQNDTEELQRQAYHGAAPPSALVGPAAPTVPAAAMRSRRNESRRFESINCKISRGRCGRDATRAAMSGQKASDQVVAVQPPGNLRRAGDGEHTRQFLDSSL